MNAATTTPFPFDGLLTCGQCGERMRLEDGPTPQYICQHGCSTPRLRAGAVDTMLLGAVLEEILTPSNTTTLLEAANEELEGETRAEHILTDRDIEDLKKKPDLLVHATGSVAETRNLLRRFLEEIQIHPGRAVVRYSIPLPDDSPLARMKHQEIDLSPDLTA